MFLSFPAISLWRDPGLSLRIPSGTWTGRGSARLPGDPLSGQCSRGYPRYRRRGVASVRSLAGGPASATSIHTPSALSDELSSVPCPERLTRGAGVRSVHPSKSRQPFAFHPEQGLKIIEHFTKNSMPNNAHRKQTLRQEIGPEDVSQLPGHLPSKRSRSAAAQPQRDVDGQGKRPASG